MDICVSRGEEVYTAISFRVPRTHPPMPAQSRFAVIDRRRCSINDMNELSAHEGKACEGLRSSNLGISVIGYEVRDIDFGESSHPAFESIDVS